jgi:putative ABC transport system permease protein
MNTVLTLFIIFSFMTLILSAILVSTSLSNLMTKQVREIGVMKTIGANSIQISGLYLLMLLMICISAVVLGTPLSKMSAGLLIKQISILLNLNLFDASIPYWVSVVQAMAGILIPLSAAAIPVFRGSRITVQDALNNYGVSQKEFGKGGFESFLARLRILGDTFTLSLRNVFRNRSRLVLTLGLLAAGGGLFMTALNMSKAWNVNLQKIYKYRYYDLEVRLNEAFPSDKLISRVRAIPGVKEVEAWGNSPTSFMKEARHDIIHTYPDKGHGSFTMVASPPATRMVKFPILGGRWLGPGNGNEVVLNHMALAQANHLKVSELVSLSVDGRPSEWKIIGFVEDLGSPATAYVSSSAFARISNTEGLTNMLRVSLSSRDRDTILLKTREIEKAIEKEGGSISITVTISLLRSAVGEHMKVLVGSLLAMAFLMAAVGVLGLMSTMGMNLFERTRELGVMRAIGATPRAIGQLIVMEGLIIVALSLVFAFILSLLLSWSIWNLIGNMSFRTPLPLSISPFALLGWTGLVFLGSILATIYPAWRVSRITTREALSY